MYHIHIGCIQSVLAQCAVDGHMGAPLYCYTCGVRGQILKNWGMGEPEWCCGVMVEAARGFRLYTTYILDVYNVFEHLDICCGWAYGCTLILLYLWS